MNLLLCVSYPIRQRDADTGEKAVLMLCCPDESYIESVLDNTKKIEATLAQQEAKLICVVHQTPANVLENEKYQEWMLSLPQGVQVSCRFVLQSVY